jgi:Mn-dependent DtxR family transcriptional regulator
MMLGDKIKHYVSKTIRQSLLNYFDYESKKQNTNIIKLNITKKALAEKIGVSRTSISRELAKMKAEALIDYSKNQIKLLYLDSK